ncbi:MAG: hypothetical protein JWO32_2257 [Bacteroidetes bacterium]|nr:hypothetical protein [Bacteroidota bacterium]
MKKTIRNITALAMFNYTFQFVAGIKINRSNVRMMHLVMLLNCAYFNTAAKVNVEKSEYQTQVSQTYIKTENVFYLQINARVKQITKLSGMYDKVLDSVRVAVYNETNKNTRVFYSDEEGFVSVKLPLNHQYQMHFSRNGLITKTIQIDTRVSKELTCYLYRFEVDMFEDIKEIDASILQSPVAEVKFNESLMCFDYTSRYTDEVNANLKKEYVKYYRSHCPSKPVRNTGETEVRRGENIPENGRQNYSDTSSIIRGGTKNKSMGKVSGITGSRNESATIYQIQIMTLAGHLPSCAKAFEGCGRVSEYVINGKYIYTVGEYKTPEQALQGVNRFRKKGFSDAFPVAVINGNVTKLTEDLTINEK